jgi:hypothetical protein
MFAASILVVALAFQAAPAPADWPPRTTVEELNSMVKAGNYHLVRQQKLGHRIESVGVVRAVGGLTMVKLSGHWWGLLHNLPENHGLKPGDRVKFRALIVDEAYAGLQLWTESWSKEPSRIAEQPRTSKT